MKKPTQAVSPGRRIELKTALPAAYVRIRWGVTDRHARRLIASGDAGNPPWDVVRSMLIAVEMAATGQHPADAILEGFEGAIHDSKRDTGPTVDLDDVAGNPDLTEFL